MYQVKILQADKVELLEELINMWLKENTDHTVVDIKFSSHSINSAVQHVAIMVYQAGM